MSIYLLSLAFTISILNLTAAYGILCLNIFYYVDQGSQAMIQKANTIHNLIQLSCGLQQIIFHILCEL